MGKFGLYDTAGATANLFNDLGIKFDRVTGLNQLPNDLDVLIIGDATFAAGSKAARTIGRIDPQRGTAMEFVDHGGRILVLRQDAYSEGLFDFSLTSQESTMTYPLQENHPALSGVAADDLKFWHGDHMVADHESPRPSSGAAVSIVVSGSKTGISSSPLLERPSGRGSMVHSQLKLFEKAKIEPAAGMILTNLLKYLDGRQPHQLSTAIVGGDESYREKLHNLGLH